MLFHTEMCTYSNTTALNLTQAEKKTIWCKHKTADVTCWRHPDMSVTCDWPAVFPQNTSESELSSMLLLLNFSFRRLQLKLKQHFQHSWSYYRCENRWVIVLSNLYSFHWVHSVKKRECIQTTLIGCLAQSNTSFWPKSKVDIQRQQTTFNHCNVPWALTPLSPWVCQWCSLIKQSITTRPILHNKHWKSTLVMIFESDGVICPVVEKKSKSLPEKKIYVGRQILNVN